MYSLPIFLLTFFPFYFFFKYQFVETLPALCVETMCRNNRNCLVVQSGIYQKKLRTGRINGCGVWGKKVKGHIHGTQSGTEEENTHSSAVLCFFSWMAHQHQMQLCSLRVWVLSHLAIGWITASKTQQLSPNLWLLNCLRSQFFTLDESVNIFFLSPRDIRKPMIEKFHRYRLDPAYQHVLLSL